MRATYCASEQLLVDSKANLSVSSSCHVMAKLRKSFYRRKDVVQISRDLIGKYLFTRFDDELTGGMIVETEAYAGPEDRASHAYGNRRTQRTEIMYHKGGVAYVYLCYGIHSLFNIVTNLRDIPHAILVRAIQPLAGTEIMGTRRTRQPEDFCLCAGPGAMSQALGITTDHSGIDLTGNKVWLEDRGTDIRPSDILKHPRVGIDYAGADAALPWRFRLMNCPWTSRAK